MLKKITGPLELGDRVKDKVTGLVGIATCRTEFLNGCTRIGIQPPVDKDGKIPDVWSIDEPTCEVVERGVIPRQKLVSEESVLEKLEIHKVKPNLRATGGPSTRSPAIKGPR